MSVRLCLICAIFLHFIPGVCCYDYNVTGLVISCLFAFFLIFPIIATIYLIVYWREWYMKKQLDDGKVRVPREYWTMFSRKVKRTSTVLSTPRSERKMPIRMHNILYTPGSRHTTLERQPEHPDAWRPPTQPVTKYEEKGQTIQFDPEEEAVMVAEILPDSQHMRTTTQAPNVIIANTGNEQQTTSYQVTDQTNAKSQTVYVSLNPDNPQPPPEPVPTRTIQSKPYHVQLTSVQGGSLSKTVATPSEAFQAPRLSQTVGPSTSAGQGQFITQTVITPGDQNADVFVPTYTRDTGSPIEEGTGVFNFDSDNEAEHRSPIDQSEAVVLF